MTIDQITALTPEERNRLIAEHLGWKFEPMSGPRSLPWRKPNAAAWDGEHWSGRATDIPNYCGSLNMMAEAEKTLSDSQYLSCIVEQWALSLKRVFSLMECRAFSAKADHRAIAFLATVLKP